MWMRLSTFLPIWRARRAATSGVEVGGKKCVGERCGRDQRDDHTVPPRTYFLPPPPPRWRARHKNSQHFPMFPHISRCLPTFTCIFWIPVPNIEACGGRFFGKIYPPLMERSSETAGQLWENTGFPYAPLPSPSLAPYGRGAP